MAYRPRIGPISCVQLNSDFSLNGQSIGCVYGIDPKLIVIKDQLKIITSYPFGGCGSTSEFIEINDLSKDLNIISDRCNRQLTIRNYPNYLQRREKSWSPFEYRDELYFIYKKNIHQVIKYNNSIKNVEYDKNMVFDNYTSMETIFGSPLHGNGNAVLFNDDLYITTFHTRIDKHYNIGYYLFDSGYPFTPRLYGKNLLIEGCKYATNNPPNFRFITCVFPGGWFDSNMETIKLSFGVNDRENHILEFSKEVLIGNCEPFEKFS